MGRPCRSLVIGALLLGMAAPASALTLYYNTPQPPLNVWHSESIPLTEGGWRVDSYLSSTFATQAELQWVLGHLNAVYVLTEWNTGPDDTNVDNIKFGTAASSSFGAGSDGWIVAGPTPTSDLDGVAVLTGGAAPWDEFEGNPAGSVRVGAGDPFFWTWIVAPGSYLGNQSARYGETFDLDIFIRFTESFAVEYPMLALVAPDVVPAGVPEPAGFALLVAGLFALGFARRKRS